MQFRDFINEDFIKTLKDKLNINPSEFGRQIFIINPPMKMRDDQGNIDEITSPTRFKITSMGKGFIRIKNLGYGNFPYEEKSKYAGKSYTIQGNHIDWFLRMPPGGGSSGGMGGIGGSMGGGMPMGGLGNSMGGIGKGLGGGLGASPPTGGLNAPKI